MLNDMANAKHWRKRAEDTRERAAYLYDRKQRRMLLKMAELYDDKAEQAEGNSRIRVL
jgi:hypothetical protein